MTHLYELGLKQVDDSRANLQDILPTYATEKSACFDVRADLIGRVVKIKWDVTSSYTIESCSGEFYLDPYERALVPTGFIFNIPEGFCLGFLSRSGHSWKNKVVVLNSPARIDQDYSFEAFVLLENQSSAPFLIKHGDRIAQGEINPVYRVKLQHGGERTGGFGSTGKA
jgi:dUTP pyrophosphatase